MASWLMHWTCSTLAASTEKYFPFDMLKNKGIYHMLKSISMEYLSDTVARGLSPRLSF